MSVASLACVPRGAIAAGESTLRGRAHLSCIVIHHSDARSRHHRFAGAIVSTDENLSAIIKASWKQLAFSAGKIGDPEFM